MKLDFTTRGQIIHTEKLDEFTVSTWYRRTMHGASGELCTSITSPIKQVGTIKSYCLDSVTSYVKWNEQEIPNRHEDKVKRMIKKHYKELGRCQAS